LAGNRQLYQVSVRKWYVPLVGFLRVNALFLYAGALLLWAVPLWSWRTCLNVWVVYLLAKSRGSLIDCRTESLAAAASVAYADGVLVAKEELKL
jgi:hypothetical protein